MENSRKRRKMNGNGKWSPFCKKRVADTERNRKIYILRWYCDIDAAHIAFLYHLTASRVNQILRGHGSDLPGAPG